MTDPNPNGVFRETTEEQYRADRAISNSDLSMLKHDPLIFRRVRDGEIANPKSSSGFAIGSLLDCKLLTPELFDERYYFRPDTITAPSSANQKAFIEECSQYPDEDTLFRENDEGPAFIIRIYASCYSASKMTAETIMAKAIELYNQLRPFIEWERGCNNRTVYTQAQKDNLALCEMGLLANPRARNLMRFLHPQQDAFDQVMLFWSETIDGIPVPMRAMLDRVVIDHKEKLVYLIDLKTTAFPLSRYVYEFEKYSYDRQMAHYLTGVDAWLYPLLETGYEVKCLHVAVNTSDGSCRVFKIPTESIIRGEEKRQELLARLVWHGKNQHWQTSREAFVNDGFDCFPLDAVNHISNLPL